MIKKTAKCINRVKKHDRMRNRIVGTTERPRLSVFRSDANIYAQIIDDTQGITLVAASTVEKEVKSKLQSTANIEAAKAVGELIAKRAVEKGITEVVYDRGGFLYHGRVQALAEAAREAGLQF